MASTPSLQGGPDEQRCEELQLVKRGALTRDGFAGKNVIRFAGKTPRAKGGVQFLSAGRYRAFFTARNENGASPEASIGFRLVRPQTS